MIVSPLLRAAAVLLLIVSLAACTESIEGDGHYADAKSASTTRPASEDPPQERLIKLEELPGLMLPAADVAAVVGVPGLQVLMPYQALEQVPDDVVSEPSCIGVMFGATEPVYRGSGYQGVYGERLADPAAMIAGRVDQGVIAFGSGPDAKAFVEGQLDSWKTCGGTPLTLKVADIQVNWIVDVPRYVNGVDVITRTQEGGDGFGCGRGILAKDNTVVDVVVCGPDPVAAGDHAAAIADGLLAKYPG